MKQRAGLLLGLALTLAACGDEIVIASDARAGCDVTQGWNSPWAAFEDEVLRLVNEQRAIGYDCGAEGFFGPASALAVDERLRCSARLHARDMGKNDYFSHESQDGRSPFDRMADVGVDFSHAGENIARGYVTPEDAMQGWLDSDGHCSNIMAPDYTALGVGYYFTDTDDYQHYWTQNFATPL